MAARRPHVAIPTNSSVDATPTDPADELTFLALGGGNEVGRSCHILQYRGKTVMLDAGIHPAYDGLAALPFYDEFDLSTVDVLLVTHFHMDHAASLPYVLAKTPFAGRVYMTHPTKSIYHWLMRDAVRVRNTHVAAGSATGAGTDGYVSQLFTEDDVRATLPRIQTVGFHTTHTHAGITFTAYPAGHVLGACMYLIEIAGLRMLFTGDYSREPSRHLIPAAVPPAHLRVDCLITESTFGISTSVPRHEREAALMKSITGILARGGRALLPVFAIGMAQELLLILEDYWARHAEYRQFPIYFASSLARKCMNVYQTHIDAMNERIQAQFQASRTLGSREDAEGAMGPWDFQYIRSLKSLDRFDDVGGCIMLASPGMLQNGVSRALLERWAPDAKNGVVLTGYSVEGTMAKQILLEPDEIPAVMTQQRPSQQALMGKRALLGADEKVMIPRRCSVQEFSFAAHVDGQENREFIEEVDAPVVILVHGEKHNMNRLKSRLLSLQKMKVYSPANCEVLRIPFRQEKVARVVGRLASDINPSTLLLSPPASEGSGESEQGGEAKRRREEGRTVTGVLVQNDFKLSLMAPEDLQEYAGLTTTNIVCRQRITLGAAGLGLIRWALEGTFGAVDRASDPVAANGMTKKGASDEANSNDTPQTHESRTTFLIMGGAVQVHCRPRGEVELEWEGNATNDALADAVMAILLTVESSPAAIRQSSRPHNHAARPEQWGEAERNDALGDSSATSKAATLPKPCDSTVEASLNGRARHPLANVSPAERLQRLFLFLEAQFGVDAITPIATPKQFSGDDSSREDDPIAAEKAQSQELTRLHALGIPVPGLEIRGSEKTHVAKVWLETLEVECGNRTFADRVRAVAERATETVAGLWG